MGIILLQLSAGQSNQLHFQSIDDGQTQRYLQLYLQNKKKSTCSY